MKEADKEDFDHEAFSHFLDRHELLLSNILDDVESHPDARFVVGCEVFEGLQSVTFGDGGPHEEDLNATWVNAPASVFFAQRLMWTALPEPAPTKDSWLVTIVIPDKPAVFFAKNVDEQLWDPFPPAHAPWFAVSTAAAMRQAAQGKPVPRLLTAQSDEVFQTPTELPVPPTNDDGVVG